MGPISLRGQCLSRSPRSTIPRRGEITGKKPQQSIAASSLELLVVKIPLQEGLETYVDTPEEEVEHTAAVTLVRQEQAVASDAATGKVRDRKAVRMLSCACLLSTCEFDGREAGAARKWRPHPRAAPVPSSASNGADVRHQWHAVLRAVCSGGRGARSLRASWRQSLLSLQ